MANPAGETDSNAIRLDFDRRLMLQFCRAVVTSDAGLLAYRELDDVLGLTTMAGDVLADARTGKNGRHALAGLFRQSVFGRLAGYEDVNDAERLRHDPAMRWIVGGKAARGCAASASQMGRFETQWLAASENLSALAEFIEAMETAVSPGCTIFTHEFRGAASRVAQEATAFGLRHDHLLVEILATFVGRSDQSQEQRHQRWARATLVAFNAMALPGGYPNMLAGTDAQRATKSFGRNAERLINAKRHYDPDNVFRSAIPLPVGQSSGRARAAANAGKAPAPQDAVN